MIIFDEIAAWPFQGQPPVFQHARAISQLKRLFDVLFDQQDGDPLLGQGFYDLEYL